MTTDRNADTSRTAVKTYVPAYQKRRWATHADELGMSQSEFVRTMVQAGRRGFSPPEDELSESDVPEEPDRSSGGDEAGERGETEPDPADATPGVRGGETGSLEEARSAGGGLKDRVVDVLDRESVLTWEELLEAVTDDIERQLDEAIQDLQTENRVRYSGREGGYTLADRR